MTRTYDTINGQIISEAASGIAKVYVVDGLGSVTGVSTNGTLSGAARYAPYGRILQGVAGAVVGWIGSWGYYPTNRAFAGHYVRARIYDAATCTWTTLDPTWPRENPYTYQSDPTTLPDPSGLGPGRLWQHTVRQDSADCSQQCPNIDKRWYVVWHLRNASAADNGYIVQKVTTDITPPHYGTMHYCGSNTNPKPVSTTFYEAWEVRKGVIYGGYTNITPGGDARGLTKGFPCQKGVVTATLVAIFFPNLKLNWDTCAGSYGFPRLPCWAPGSKNPNPSSFWSKWKGRSNSVTSSMVATIHCCCSGNLSDKNCKQVNKPCSVVWSGSDPK